MSHTTQSDVKTVVERAFEAWDEHDPDAFEEVYAQDVIHRNLDLGGLNELQRSAGVWFDAFPDLEHTIEAMVAEDNLAVARVRITGTHDGESELFGGLAPTGNTVEFLGMFMERVEDGKIVERWIVENHYTVLEQLDAL